MNRSSQCLIPVLCLFLSHPAWAKKTPLKFDSETAASELSLKLEYELVDSKKLKLGTAEFSDETFRFLLLRANSLNKKLTQSMSKDEASQWVILGDWPQALMQSGKIEVIDRGGRSLWVSQWTKKEMSQWQELRLEWQKKLVAAGVKTDEVKKLKLFSFQFGLMDVNSDNSPFWKLSEPFRFCVSQQVHQSQSRMCTRYYEVSKESGRIALRPFAASDVPARVIVMNENAPLTAQKDVGEGSLVQFYAEVNSGASIEFVGKPRRLNLVEIAKSKSDGQLIVTGWGVKPQEDSVRVEKEKESKWVQMLGWQDTIGDDREFWKTLVNVSSPRLTVPGEGAGVFVQTLPVQDLPPEEARPFLADGTLLSTYKSTVNLKGQVNPSVKLSSQMRSLQQNENGSFMWNFQADKSADLNKSYVNIISAENTYKAYTEIYRAFPGDFSFRLTGGLGGGKGMALGESALNYWFENLFGWQSAMMSVQRWGVSAKYFMSLTDLTTNDVTAPLKAMTVDFKYRFTPGVWNRDASWGLILGYNDLDYSSYKAKMLGGGFFWGRSMPLVFDNIFNWLPFFRFPKWVDLEFIYYPSILDSAYASSGSSNYALNFHGKVLWSKRIFGEAGFGVKNIGLLKKATITESEQSFNLATFYATVGLGILF